MENLKITLLFALVVFLILITGFVQSWNTALLILNMGLISAIMSLGVNLQWGFAGLFNVGIMGFVALGGLAAVLVSAPPVYESWSVGGIRIIAAIIFGVFVIITIGIRELISVGSCCVTASILIDSFASTFVISAITPDTSSAYILI